MLRQSDAERLLQLLCSQQGLTLAPDDITALVKTLPASPSAFTASILRADGVTSPSADWQRYRKLCDIVENAYRESEAATVAGADGEDQELRVVPIDALAEWSTELTPAAVAFPFSSPRSAGRTDPSLHDVSTALELFVLAVSCLSVRYREPDFPSSYAERPHWMAKEALIGAGWMFDYYCLTLELWQRGDSARVWYRMHLN
jgi:hypothetical protein